MRHGTILRFLYFPALQNQLKVVWGIVQKEHEDIDERYSKEMHSLVTQLLAKVPFLIIGDWDSVKGFLKQMCGAKKKKGGKKREKDAFICDTCM